MVIDILWVTYNFIVLSFIICVFIDIIGFEISRERLKHYFSGTSLQVRSKITKKLVLWLRIAFLLEIGNLVFLIFINNPNYPLFTVFSISGVIFFMFFILSFYKLSKVISHDKKHRLPKREGKH